MKNKEQQELCRLLEEFHEKKDPGTFQNLVGGMFQCPLLFPVGKGENKGQYLLAENEQNRFFSAFSDMEEAEKAKLGDIDYITHSIEEYCTIVAQNDVQGLVINMFNENNCLINRDFFKNVVSPAFRENRIMPGLKYLETGQYFPVVKMPFAVGRGEAADLRISKNTIDDIHGIIIEREGTFYITDRNSVNGIYVNGEQVPAGGEQKIVFDDIIEFYDVEFAFVPLGMANRQELQQPGQDS